MTKFGVLVCLSEPPGDLYGTLGDVLAPFDENREVEPYRDYLKDEPSDYRYIAAQLRRDPATLTWEDIAAYRNATINAGRAEQCVVDENGCYEMSTWNRDAKWDYWGIGIRPDFQRLRHLPGHESLVLRDTPNSWDPPQESRLCYGGPKASLDIEGMRADAAAATAARYDRWLDAVRGTPEARPWRDFYDPAFIRDARLRQEAEDAYNAQPRVRALAGTEFDAEGWYCSIEVYQRSREECVEYARANAMLPWAVLLTDGRWLEYSSPGRIGFMPPDKNADQHFIDEANLEIDTLPDTGWLVSVSCHC